MPKEICDKYGNCINKYGVLTVVEVTTPQPEPESFFEDFFDLIFGRDTKAEAEVVDNVPAQAEPEDKPEPAQPIETPETPVAPEPTPVLPGDAWKDPKYWGDDLPGEAWKNPKYWGGAAPGEAWKDPKYWGEFKAPVSEDDSADSEDEESIAQ